MTPPSCTTCKHSFEHTCRRNPPGVAVVLLPTRHPISGQTTMTPQVMGAFPPIQDEHFCGEYTAKILSLTSH